MTKKSIYRIASILIVLSVLFSQLGLKFLHTHLGQAPDSAITFTVLPDNDSTPCPACSMDGMPVLYTDAFYLPTPVVSASLFVESFPAEVRFQFSGPSLGRAPPIA